MSNETERLPYVSLYCHTVLQKGLLTFLLTADENANMFTGYLGSIFGECSMCSSFVSISPQQFAGDSGVYLGYYSFMSCVCKNLSPICGLSFHIVSDRLPF